MGMMVGYARNRLNLRRSNLYLTTGHNSLARELGAIFAAQSERMMAPAAAVPA